jgi:hypothetical protein
MAPPGEKGGSPSPSKSKSAVRVTAKVPSPCCSTRAQAKGQLACDVQSDRLADFIFAGIEGAILLTKVRKDLTVLEGCLDELKKYVRMHVALQEKR